MRMQIGHEFLFRVRMKRAHADQRSRGIVFLRISMCCGNDANRALNFDARHDGEIPKSGNNEAREFAEGRRKIQRLVDRFRGAAEELKATFCMLLARDCLLTRKCSNGAFGQHA
jgi:hypothetical protein